MMYAGEVEIKSGMLKTNLNMEETKITYKYVN